MKIIHKVIYIAKSYSRLTSTEAQFLLSLLQELGLVKSTRFEPLALNRSGSDGLCCRR